MNNLVDGEQLSHISTEYASAITSAYDESIAMQLDNWQTAQLRSPKTGTISFARLNSAADKDRRPVLFVYGYMGGIVANGPFGADMASRGYDIIVSDQNRSGIGRNQDDHRDATYNQAENIASIIINQCLEHTPLDIVTHSYGSLIFDSLHDFAYRKRWMCFNGSNVAMLAPAGIKQDDNKANFLIRYSQELVAGPKLEKLTNGFSTLENEMFEAGKQHLLANKRRALLEGVEIASRKVNLQRLTKRGVGKMAIVLFAEDKLFSEKTMAVSLPLLVNESVTAFSPVSSIESNGRLCSGRGAGHADHQFNPSRVAGAVDEFLRSSRPQQ